MFVVAGEQRDITQLLVDVRSGDEAAGNALSTIIYDELLNIARGLFAHERREHTLQPTAIVHEVYIRLIGPNSPSWENRVEFYASAARAMRSILIDHARRVRAQKRGGGWGRVTLGDASGGNVETDLDVLEIEDALVRLQAMDPRKARVIELRFFGGLTNEEVATVLGVSRKTVVQDWTVARAWLSRELRGGSTP